MEYKILMVDNNRLMTSLFSKLLHSLGYEVSVAHSAKEALRMIKKIKPKVVLSDIGMPVIDGYELAKEIKQNKEFSEIILIALTGKCKMHDKQKARQAGFDHYINKSANISEIKMILNAYDY